MACTDAHSCILVSYHPETKFGNFFLVQRNNIIIDILIDVCNAILDKTVIDTWVYNDTNEYRNLGKKISGRSLDFETLKPLRVHINKQMKKIAKITFIDKIDF